MYAFVITKSKPISLIFLGGIDCFTGWITGTYAGVSTLPWFVYKIPILAARSLFLISNISLYINGALFEVSRKRTSSNLPFLKSTQANLCSLLEIYLLQKDFRFF